MLTEADRLYIRDAHVDDLREELANSNDDEYRAAIAKEILSRTHSTEEAQ